MHPLLKIPGFVLILAVGLAVMGYGLSLELTPNWVIAIGIILLVVAVLSITVVR